MFCISAVTLHARATSSVAPTPIRAGQGVTNDQVHCIVTICEPDSDVEVVEVVSEIAPVKDTELCSLPSPTQLRLQRLSKKTAKVLADKISKAVVPIKSKKDISKRSNSYFKTCKTSCNSNKTFYNDVNSRSHLSKVADQQADLHCFVCSRNFLSAQNFAIHNASSAHFKAVRKLHSKN